MVEMWNFGEFSPILSHPMLSQSLLHLLRHRYRHGFRWAAAAAPHVLLPNLQPRSYGCGEVESRPGPLALYKSMVKQGKLQHDCYQEKVASELETLLGRLQQYEKDMEEYHMKLADWEENREMLRQKLLLEEAELKHQNGVWLKASNHGSRFVNKLISREDYAYGHVL